MKYRLAFVTGATSGIGKAICERFAKEGIHLLISGRDQQQLEILKSHLSTQVNVQAFPADLLESKDRKYLIREIHAQVPDLVINNAGFGLYGEALTYPTQEQLNIMEVNAVALLELTLEAARTLASMKKKGVIFNISSAAAFQIFPSMAVYAASKAFVNHFSQAFDFEVAQYGIRVLTLCPGMVATHFQERAGGTLDKDKIGVMTPSFVADQVWKQIERLDPLVTIDWKYRCLIFLSSLLPKKWVARIEKNIIESRIAPRALVEIKK